MTPDSIIRQAFIELQEDYNYPGFWTIPECLMYLREGFSDLLRKTQINISETEATLLPEFPFRGNFEIPLTSIQSIKQVYWRKDGKLIKLEVRSPAEMDVINPDWRSLTGETPRYAVEWRGNKSPFRPFLKVIPYPDAVSFFTEDMIETYNEIEDIIGSGLLGTFTGDLQSMVDYLTIDGNQLLPDDANTLIENINVLLANQNSNGLVIRYIPETLRWFENNSFVESDLDDLIPPQLQIALREYVCYRCFRKEGEAQDQAKEFKYKQLYENIISDYRSENFVWRNEPTYASPHFMFRQGGSGWL